MTPDDANMLVAEFWNQGAGKGGRLLSNALAEFAERVSEQAVAGERDACAEVALAHKYIGVGYDDEMSTAREIAKAIRSRGETGKLEDEPAPEAVQEAML